MGFRSTFTSEDKNILWPDWFVTKYRGLIHFHPENRGPISSVHEAKTYMTWESLPEDIQRVMQQSRVDDLTIVYLHECGGITRCEIHNDQILWNEPSAWETTEGVTHHYCYGCSDVR